MNHWARVVLEELDGTDPKVTGTAREGLRRMARIVERLDVHQFRTDELADLADALAECVDLEDLARIMWTATTSCGFENFIVFVIRNGSNGTPRSRVCTSCNETWIRRYERMNYQFVDPAMAAARGRDGHFLFSDLEDSAPPVKAFWDDAEAHRIGRNGICYTFDRPDRSRIGVSFLTAKSVSQCQKNVRLNGHDLMVLASLAVDAFSYLSYGPNHGEELLTEEELRFLHTLTSWRNPEDAFKITAGFGSNKALQSSIRRKLGAESVFQAIAIASARGYFDDLPYDVNEVTRPFPELSGLDETLLKQLNNPDGS
ncbi:MAG: autoinducer binding domain-containing protein [Pseudomonadota bacterium]